MRRLVPLVFAMALLAVAGPAAVAAPDMALDVTVDKAPVTPDGTTAGAITDFVVTFADRDPAVDGISLKTGGTVTVTLPEDFVNTGAGSPNAMILLQGWPQSPPAPPPGFLWTTAISGTTITATLTSDYLVGDFGPGAKQAHLLLNAFRNPGPGAYDVHIAIQPDPASSAAYAGTGTVHILPKARPSVNVVSVFSGGGPAPPLNNPLYQSLKAGDTSLDVGMYLWDKGSSAADGVLTPMLDVAVEMTNPRHGKLVQAEKNTVGQVWISAPPRAHHFGISTNGPSIAGTSAVTGFDTGILVWRLHTDPAVTGEYTVTIRLNNGNTQHLSVTAD